MLHPYAIPVPDAYLSQFYSTKGLNSPEKSSDYLRRERAFCSFYQKKHISTIATVIS